MAKKTRHSKSKTGVARPSPVARPAATSRPWAVISPIHRPVPQRVVSVTQRVNKRLRSAAAARRPLTPSKGVSFGTWHLPPSPTSSKPAKALSVCHRRSVRRQSLFATRATGAGARARRRHYSNTRCK